MGKAEISFLSLLFLLLVSFCVSIQATAPNSRTMTETLPAYAITNYVHLLNSSRCRSEMEEFRKALDHGVMWSLRMLDASGKPSTGFVHGNNFWTGSLLDCNILNFKLDVLFSEKTKKIHSLYLNPAEEQPPYEVHFFGANIQHNSTFQYHFNYGNEFLIILGLCLPNSCTENEVATMLHEVLRSETLLMGQLFSTSFKLINVNDLIDDHQWLLDWHVIIIIIILVLLCVTIITGTLLDIMQRYSSEKSEPSATGGIELKNNNEQLNGIGMNQEEVTPTKLKSDNRGKKCLLCFSLYSNALQTFDLRKNSESILIFNSIRFVGMAWIITSHICYFIVTYANKFGYNGIIIMTPMLEFVINVSFAVDMFFFMSGFLLTYTFLKNHKVKKEATSLKSEAKDLVIKIVKRYFRITPSLAVVIMATILNSTWQDNVSLIPLTINNQTMCFKYWWRTLFYVNNFYDFDNMCIPWSWYLANDFQYFIFGSILLLLSKTYYKISIGIGAASIIGSIASSVSEAYRLNFHLAMQDINMKPTNSYARPWIRIAPFLIGMATSQLLSKWNYKLNLSKKMLAICWIFAIVCNCAILFPHVNKNITFGIAVLYAALSKIAWAIGIAWIVIAYCTNNAGIVNKFLSLPVWIPLGRLSYCCYLIHPFIMDSVSRHSVSSIYWDTPIVSVLSVGFILIGYICAFVLATAVEIPFIRLIRVLETTK